MLLVDNGSVFTNHIEDCLGDSIKSRMTPAELDDETIKKYDSFILSGRRHNNKKTNAINSKIILHADSTDKPLFGICYGAEMIALSLGGTIRRMPHIHTGSENVIFEKNPLCDAGRKNVFESHTYEITNLGSKIERIAKSQTCENEFIRVHEKLIFGSQFHPEETGDGRNMLLEFAQL